MGLGEGREGGREGLRDRKSAGTRRRAFNADIVTAIISPPGLFGSPRIPKRHTSREEGFAATRMCQSCWPEKKYSGTRFGIAETSFTVDGINLTGVGQVRTKTHTR